MQFLITLFVFTILWNHYLQSPTIPDCEGFYSVNDFHEVAKDSIEPRALRYFDGFALHGLTYRENVNAFNRLRIRPRYMRDVSDRSLSVTLLGDKVSVPIGISPHAAQRGAHTDGENATAIAAAAAGIVMILSTYSTISMEQVAEVAPGGIRWFQMHIFPNRQLTLDMVRRAERAGYKALVLTVDFPVEGIRYFSDKEHYLYPDGMTYGNFEVYLRGLHSSINMNEAAIPDPNTTWSDVMWLKSNTHLPIVIKGILTAEDAQMAMVYGAAAILVSNHGGRQLDGAPATIDALPEIVKKVQGRIEVYLDGGIRTGADAFKALALGAKAVFYGRPNIWGLSYHGTQGAKCVIDVLKRELDVTMALAGFKSVLEINLQALMTVEHNGLR